MKALRLDKDRLIHSIKTAFACLIGYVITKSIHIPVDQWLLITILIVMCAQLSVGSMIQKSTMRFLGTLSGSIVAALTMLTLGVTPLAIGLIIAISAAFFSYLATDQAGISESGTLGAATTVIILLGPSPTLTTACGRFLEITAGIIIAALVSQFILPIHARKILRRKQTETLHQLRAYYLATLLTNQSDKNTASYHDIDEEIIKSLIAQRKLATEAAREPFAKNINIVAKFTHLLSCEREMLRSITFMHHAYKHSPECKKIFSNMIMLRDFHDKICESFDIIADHIEKQLETKPIIDIPSIEIIKTVIFAEISHLNENNTLYANAFLFCAEILVGRLHEIAKLIH